MEQKTQKGKTGPGAPKVLVAIDASESSDLVIKRSGQFARATDCNLTILTVVEDVVHYDTIPDIPVYHEKKEKAEEVLKKAEQTLKSQGVDCVTRLTIGPVVAEIVRIADEGRFDVIFMGSRGLGGFKRMLIGSVADNVIRHAHCSVTVLR